MRARSRTWPLVPILLTLAVMAATALSTGRAPRELVTLVLWRGHARAVAPGAFYFKPPGALVLAEPRSGAFRFPSDDAYRLVSADSAEIPVTFEIRYALQDAAPLLDYRNGGATGQPPAVGASFVSDVLVAAFQSAARPAAAGLGAGVIYRSEGRALVEALTRELELPRGVEVDVTLHSLAMSASAQHILLTESALSRSRPVLFMGIEGLDWIVLEPLVAEGRVPNLTRLLRGGVRADLRTPPPLLSPVVWTSIGTGGAPAPPGNPGSIADPPGPGRPGPADTSARSAPAFWNVASYYGRTVNVVGWPTTWPAEPIRGVMVSDRFGFRLDGGGAAGNWGSEGAVAPAEALPRLRGLSFQPDQLGFEKLSRFLDVSRADLAAARGGAFRRGDLVNNFLRIYAAGETSRRIGVDLLRRPADITTVNFEFLDALGHLFMPYAPPRRSGVTVVDFDRYRDAIKIGYVEMDRWVGSLLDAAGDSTIVMVASDHGFLSGSDRPTGPASAQAARWHRDPGVLILSGPGVRRGGRIEPATVLDIAPTLLHLAGLPVSRERIGAVLTTALTAEELAARPVQEIDAYRIPAGVRSPPAAVSAAAAAPAAAQAGAVTGAQGADAPTWIDLGVRRLAANDAAGAVQAFDQALTLEPRNARAHMNRGHAWLRLRKPEEARASFRRALELSPAEANAHFGLGLLAAEAGDFRRAQEEFEETLRLDPSHRTARENLGRLKTLDRRER